VSRLPRIPGAAAYNDKVALAVDATPPIPYVGRLYVAWSRLDPRSAVYEIVVSHSDDAGATWSRAIRVSGARWRNQTYASVAVDADGTLFVAWLTYDRHVHLDRKPDAATTSDAT